MIRSLPNAQSLRGQPSYDDVYRHRLWQYAVSDAQNLGMGYRAYSAHIKNTLASWLKHGISVEDWKGDPINVDVLSANDMYGFLGRDKENASGPQRKIGIHKLTILDIYFKKAFLDAEDKLKYENNTSKLAYELRTFFTGQSLSPVIDGKDLNELSKFVGIYIPDYTSSGSGAEFGASYLDISPHDPITMTILNHRENDPFLIIHRVRIPILPSLVKNRRDLFLKIYDSKEWFSRQGEKFPSIFSGIAVPTSDLCGVSGISFECLLRHRSLYSPETLSLLTRRFEYQDSNRTCFANVAIEYNQGSPICGYKASKNIDDLIRLCDKLGFSEEFAEKSYNFFETLGVEV